MATITTYIYKDKPKGDGTWKIYIRLTHERKTKYIPTNIFATKKDLTPAFKIKNTTILYRVDELISYYKKKLYELNLDVVDVPIDKVVEYLTRKGSNTTSISFTSWARKWIENKAKESQGSSNNYQTALNAFSLFLGREELLMDDINVRTLTSFAQHLSDKPRAQSLYTTSIMKMFNDARDFYNDEDNELIRIKHSLRKFKVPKQNVAEKRALSTEQIKAIFDCPYDNLRSRGLTSRHDLALDCFRLSFALMGMNSVDLHACSVVEDNVIKYDRAKTKGRRADKAHMEVVIPDCVKHLYEKYKDETGERVFNFYQRFKKSADLNRAINLGLKVVGDELGIKGLEFYSARHSVASIAINEVGVDMWTVNLMLAHTAPSMKVTELYITKDYSQENKAMQKVLDYVLYDKK